MALMLSPTLSPQGTLSDHQDSIPAVLAGRFLAEVEFFSDSVRVVVQQPRDVTDAERDVYNSAYRQCWAHMATNPPKEFHVTFLEDNHSGPETEVVIQSSLVEKLPLLQDVAKSTGAVAELTHDEFEDDLIVQRQPQVANMALSCSVWGLVSLLLLLEGNVTMKHWFASCCPDSDPGLPAQTVEASEFMGCKKMTQAVVDWLQRVLKDVLIHNETANLNRLNAESLHHSCPRVWHNTQVLQKLDGKMAKEVFGSLSGTIATAAKRAVFLPQDLFASWVASVVPVLDLRDVHLSHTQWVRLAVCIAQSDPRAVTSLHVSAATTDHTSVSPEQVEQVQQLLLFCASESTETDSCCCSCEMWCTGKPSLVTVGSKCEAYACSSFAPTIGAPKFHFSALAEWASANEALCSLQHFCETAQLGWSLCSTQAHENEHVPSAVSVGFLCTSCGQFCATEGAPTVFVSELSSPAQGRSEEFTQVLCTLGWSLSPLKNLKHLGLHHLIITPEILSSLGQLFSSLPPSVSVLTIAIDKAAGAVHELPERLLFFKAVALVRGLKKLHFPQWEVLVGADASECVRPLLDLPLLETVYVNEVKGSSAFPKCLDFKVAEYDL